jgi:sporulation protein YlmC with PRC-barrel domain
MEGGMAHKLVPSDRVERKTVFLPDADKVGTIERLMIDKTTGRVAYAVLKMEGLLGFGAKHFPIPWQALKYNPTCKRFEILLSGSELHDRMSEQFGRELDMGDRTPIYRHPHYWDE